MWPALAAAWLALAWAIQDLTDHYDARHWFVLPITIAAACGIALTLRRDGRGPWLVLATGACAGVIEHLWRPVVSQSGVLPEIVQAAGLFWAGHDPYRLPGTALIDGLYLYPPGPLFVYGLFVKLGVTPIETVERVSSIFIVLLLAGTARWVGPGRAGLAATVYGTYLFGTFRALDGDNNSTLAALFIAGSLLLMRGEVEDRRGRAAFWAAVPILALGVLLKQLAWPVYAFLALHLLRTRRGQWHVAATLAIVAAVILPFAIDDHTMLLRMLAVAGNKPTVYGLNVLSSVQMFDPALATRLIPAALVTQLVAAAIAAVALTRTGSRDVPDALMRSLGLMLVLMLLSNWTSPAYYMFMGSIFMFVVAVADARPPSRAGGTGWVGLMRFGRSGRARGGTRERLPR